MTKTISFARVPGAGTSAPAEELKNITPPAEAAQPASTALATQPSRSVGWQTGGEEDGDGDGDPKDVKFPRLNMVQGLSDEELKRVVRGAGIVGDTSGHYVLKRALYIPKPFSAVIAAFRKKYWVEAVKYGGDKGARMAFSHEEIAALGGTDVWRDSKACENSGSTRPWFMPTITGLFMIRRPEGADEDHFQYIDADGVAYAPALYTLKSTSFDFYVQINSEKKGLFKNNFASRAIEINSKALKNNYVPTVRIGLPTSEATRQLISGLLGQ